MFDENSNCQTSATSALSAANGSMAMVNHLMNVKDSRWLQLEVCREFQRGQCSRTENECKFAHPPPHVDVQNGRVTACYDSIKVRLNRSQLVGLAVARHQVSSATDRPQPIPAQRTAKVNDALPKIAIARRNESKHATSHLCHHPPPPSIRAPSTVRK